MGAFQSSFTRLFPRKDTRMLLLGLDNAGKTTILYKLKLGEIVTTIPTIGFSVESVESKTVHLTSWDVGGRSRTIRPLWRAYWQEVRALIFVVNSGDREMLDSSEDYETAKTQLQWLLAEEGLAHTALLIYANKQDLPNAMSVDEITTRLGLQELRNRPWHVQGCCATSGEGLQEGFDWLAKTLNTLSPPPAPKVFTNNSPADCAMCGLDGAGKSSLLQRMNLGAITTTIPADKLFVESIRQGPFSIVAWDNSGRTNTRVIMRVYYEHMRSLIFVVDSTNRDRIDDADGGTQSAKEILHALLAEEAWRHRQPLLVLANKQDAPNAMLVEEIVERLGLKSLAADRDWLVQGCSAMSGVGLREGLEWLSHARGREQRSCAPFPSPLRIPVDVKRHGSQTHTAIYHNGSVHTTLHGATNADTAEMPPAETNDTDGNSASPTSTASAQPLANATATIVPNAANTKLRGGGVMDFLQSTLARFTRRTDDSDMLKEARLVLTGLPSAGKTALLYRLALAKSITTMPTIGFNVETVHHPASGVALAVWDLGGRGKMRELHRHYYPNADALIHVVDSTGEHETLQDASSYGLTAHDELHRILADESLSRTTPLLVFATKQDVDGAQSIESIAQHLGLAQLQARAWHIQGCSAVTGDGLKEGLDWLVATIREQKRTNKTSSAPRTPLQKLASTSGWTSATPDAPPNPKRAATLPDAIGDLASATDGQASVSPVSVASVRPIPATKGEGEGDGTTATSDQSLAHAPPGGILPVMH